MHTLLMFTYLFAYLAVPGLCCCTRAFSGFREQGLLSRSGVQASHRRGFPRWGAQALACGCRQLWRRASLVGAPGPQSVQPSVVAVHSLLASWYVKSSRLRDRTCVLCISRQTFIPCATRKVLGPTFIIKCLTHKKYSLAERHSKIIFKFNFWMGKFNYWLEKNLQSEKILIFLLKTKE